MEDDPAREWQRMQEVYSQMSEDELLCVADEAYDLTDIARQTLEWVIKSRGLKIQLANEPAKEAEAEPELQRGVDAEEGEFDPEELELVSVHTAWEESEARTAKQILDVAGIPSYFGPENLESIDQYKGSYARGIHLKVPYRLQQLASAALRSEWPKDPNAEGEPDVPAAEIRCPKCHSDEVVFESIERPAGDESEVDTKYNWHCDACGNEWQDDGVEQEA